LLAVDRADSERREVAAAAEALQDSYGALVALERTEVQLARTHPAFGEPHANIGGDEQARAVAALNHVIAQLRAAQGQASTDQAVTSLSHVIVELRAATAYAATAHAIASLRRAINAVRWLAGEGQTGKLASGFVAGRKRPPASA
jgi:hypothetical protein